METIYKKKFGRALNSINPEQELEKIVLALKHSGVSQKKVYMLFSKALKYYSENGTEDQDNALRNIMDRIVGWCSRDRWYFDDYLKT